MKSETSSVSRRVSFALLVALLVGSAVLPEAIAQGGKYERFVTSDLKRTLKEMPKNRVPQFAPGLSTEQKQEVVGAFDQAMKNARAKGAEPGLLSAISMWEAMSYSEKEQALSGGRVLGVAPVVAALVGAAALGYAIAKDLGNLAGGKEVVMRSMNSSELDFVQSLDVNGFGGSGSPELRSSSSDLDYDFSDLLAER
ncbi:MAG: hypothetical protein DWQ36_07480 [Acidobacteria bacterium]|nr:MAG: hypothetical protein DWQ30_11835 [Acidobacteriota bacterium]REK09158.1 MAG: hypothetical protein DWQ36_07480 [Acidobacteriota bacterium]